MNQVRAFLTTASVRGLLILVLIGVGVVFQGASTADPTAAQAPPTGENKGIPLAPVEPAQEELAEYMGRLQGYTHKLSLSVAEGNQPLAGLYLHESLELLKEIQETFPEYERIPVALLIDRMALAAYEPLKTVVARPAASWDQAEADRSMDVIIQTCNSCHTASQFPFVRIGRNPFNPFMQNFKPLPTP